MLKLKTHLFSWCVISALLMGCVLQKKHTDKSQTTINKPNIIYILADDLGYGELGSFGQQKILTPNIDALAENGLKFTQHYAGSTVCAPSRASLMTGHSTAFSQIRGNYEFGGYRDEEEKGQFPLKAGTQTIATVLKSAGYKTAAIGKWGLGGPGTEGEPHHQGFDYFFGYLDQKQAHNYYPTHLWRNGTRVPLNNEFFIPHHKLNGTSNKPDDYQLYMGKDYAPDRLRDEALTFIKDAATEQSPFFLYLAFVTPHAALQTPDENIPSYTQQWPEPAMQYANYTPHPRPRAARAAMISNMDKSIGMIIKQLEALDLAENTLVIFTSDNGPSPEGGADITFFNSSGPLRGGKRDLYEGGIRVPMIAYWPGTVLNGQTTDHISAFWDVMPTFAELAQTSSPYTEGVSFLPTLLGNPNKQQQHESLYWEFKFPRADGSIAGQAVRIGDFKTICYHKNTEQVCELYNLSKDIREENNLAERYPFQIESAKNVMKQRSQAVIPEWNF